MNRSGIIIFVFLILDSCISPYEPKTPFQQQIVVEGMITDQPGPYVVKLSRTLPVDDQLGESPEISGATVVIQDDQGNSENLVERPAGSYHTTLFEGVVGRSYWITIVTPDGNAYQSSREKLSPVGDFTNLRYEFDENEPPFSNNQISSTNGFRIFIDSNVLPEQENRVWWRWTGTFEILTYPQFRTKLETTKGVGDIYVPDPPICSAYYVRLDGALVGPFRDCTCCNCWVTQYNESPIISDSHRINHGKITNLNVDFIEANCRTFYQKYYLQVDQMSLSAKVYEFWQGVQTQNQNGTNLFQTPPPRTVGNITAITVNAPPLLGYFAASSIKSHVLVIDRTAIPYPMREIDTLVVECTGVFKNSVASKPAFW